ncbi:MAG: aldolase catalytic domain-containing protein [Oscillospiraceae bacterium]|nr:aldolase catalytic domain-containing protein [Oscillospiraceae bacterium]
MPNIQLLDCTLRDGGYINDWEFGHNNIISILNRLEQAGVDIIELGFLDGRRPFDINRTIMPDTACAARIAGNNKRSSMLVGMIDYGTCGIENLQPASESILDGIRVIFKKQKMNEAMEFCGQVKALGYKVFSQLVSITSYSDEELIKLIDLVNRIKPYAVSMVDTYGLLHPEELLHYYDILDRYAAKEIQIGFHAHNNFQLAYANDITFIGKSAQHDIVVDATLYGMGKSAGNSQIELVAMYLNDKFGKDYKINYLLEAIEETVMDFYGKSPWGYKMFYYLSAKNRCHPNYVSKFLKKENLSLTDLDRILGEISPESAKLLYDSDTADSLYDEFENELDDTNDYFRLSRELSGKKILVMGPGKNVELQKNKIREYIKEHTPVIIAINYIPEEFGADYVFVTNRKRHRQMTEGLEKQVHSDIKLIATTNITAGKTGFEYRLKISELLEAGELYSDNSFIMLIKALRKCGISEISCAGLDGYSNKEDNYFNPKMEYSFVKSQAEHLNNKVRALLFEKFSDMNFNFITYSKYTEREDCYDGTF